MKNLKELNSKEIGKLVVMCKSDGTPIKMDNGKYIAVAYDSDKSDAENVKACKDFARENKIGEGAISKAKFKKMKETSLTEDLEFMPNDKGGVKVKKVADGYKSNVTRDKSKDRVADLEVKKYLKEPTPNEIGLAKAVLKDLKSKGKEGDVTKKMNIDPKPDVVAKCDGSVEINPDNGKASYKLSAKELEKFEENKLNENLSKDDYLYLELTEKGKDKFMLVDEHGNPADPEMEDYFYTQLVDKYFYPQVVDTISYPEDGPECDDDVTSNLFVTTPEKLAEMFENESNVEFDDFIVGLGFTKTEEDYIDEYTGQNYGPMETYHVTDVIEDLYSIWETDDEEPPFGDPNDPTDYSREGERGEMPEHDMGEMYGVPYGASSEEALKHFESRKNKRRPIKETMDTFDGVCPYCGNPVGLDTTECGYCGFDLSDYDECQTDDVDYEGLSGKRFEESEERKLAENPFEDFFKGYEMVMKGMRGLKEGELRTMNRAQALQFARQNRMPGAAFSANTPAEIKKGLQMMKAQLRDMQANRGRYELALQRGFVIAGFGGDLHGIEVPETLMTGELPAGTTPEQAFDQVVDFMRKTIASLTIKLAKAGKDPTALPKQPTKYLESKKLHEKIGVKGHFGIQVRLGCKNNKGDDYLNQILGENGIPAEDAEPFEKATKKEVEESNMYKNAIKKYGKDNVTIIKF